MTFTRISAVFFTALLIILQSACSSGGGGTIVIQSDCSSPNGYPESGATCCTGGQPNPNANPQTCGGPQSDNIRGQIDQAADSLERGVASLNFASELVGNSEITDANTPTALAATAANGESTKNPPSSLKPGSLAKKSDFEFNKPKSKLASKIAGGGQSSGSSNSANISLPGTSPDEKPKSPNTEERTGAVTLGVYGGAGGTGVGGNQGKGAGLSGIFGKSGMAGGKASGSGSLDFSNENAGREPASNGAGFLNPEDYFALMNPTANLFKKVSDRYNDVNTRWSVEDSRKLTDYPDAK